MFKKVFKNFFVISALFLTVVIPSVVCLAEDASWDMETVTSIENPLDANDFTELVTSIIEWVRNIGVLLAVLMIIWSGFLFMTAGGEEDKVTKARKTLMWALIGLAILIMGENFIALIKNILSQS